MRRSTGTLLYRHAGGVLEVLLVRPRLREPWTIPQGSPRDDESLEAAARREALEETGVHPDGLVELCTTSRLACFAGEAPPGASIRPPLWLQAVEFVPLIKARRLIRPELREPLDRLVERLSTT